MHPTATDTAHAMPERARYSIRPGRRTRRRLLAWAIGLAVVALATALLLRYRSAHRVESIRYETATVDRGRIAAHVSATGTLSALVTVIVGSQVSGRIASLSADYGSTVEKGQVVATIDPSLFKSAVAQARANLSAARAALAQAQAQEVQARRQHQRAKLLVAQGLVSVQEFEIIEANLDVAVAAVRSSRASVAQADAALAQAKLNLEYCTIRSPIDGVVISRNVDEGQTVAAAFQAPTLFTIAQDLTKMQVDTAVAEADVAKVEAGMPVTFTVDAYPTRVFEGVVRQVRDDAQTIQNVVTYDAVIDVDNSERLLKPSMTATVTFAYATRDDALRVPNAALRFRPSPPVVARMLGNGDTKRLPGDLKPDERLLWVMREGRARPTTVRIGISDGDTTEILDGALGPGDRVVIEASMAADRARPGA